MVWWCLSGSPSVRFPHFSPTRFDILSWNFAQDFLLMYNRSSLSVVTLRQCLKELWVFLNLEYMGNTQFSSLFSYMFWHTELKFCIWLSYNVIQMKFEGLHFASIFEGVMPLLNLQYTEYAVFQFSALFSYMLWHNELKFWIWLSVDVQQIKLECRHFASIFEGVTPLFEIRI